MPAKKAAKKPAKPAPIVAVMADQGEQPNKGGRPPFQVTPDMRNAVKQLSAFGIPHENICQMISPDKANPIDQKTLVKHFGYELANGKQEAVAKIAGTLFKTAMEGNVNAMLFYLRTQGRWKDAPTEVELSGKEGGPIITETVVREVVTLPEYKDAVNELLGKF